MTDNILRANNISVTLNDTRILENLDMTLTRGEFVGIIGPNGAGKSTFLKAVRGIVPKSSGEVWIGERQIGELTEKEIAKQLAFMQQDMQIGFGFTAEEVVLSARYPYLAWWENEGQEDRRIAEKCMHFTGVYHLRDKMISQLSGGERQRVLLAKILAQQTDIIFLDEPTASLDLVYQEEIFRYCRELTQSGKTIVMICHDLTMAARFCSRLLLIAKGQIVAEGKPADVLTAENIRKGFGLNALVYENPVSGELDIYTLEKNRENRPLPQVYVEAAGPTFCALVRSLYGKADIYAPVLSDDTLAAYCAEVFGVHIGKYPPGEETSYAFIYDTAGRIIEGSSWGQWHKFSKVYFDSRVLNAEDQAELKDKLALGQYIDLDVASCVRLLQQRPEEILER